MNATSAQATHPGALWDGFWGIQLLHIGQTLGLFEALEEGQTPAELAKGLGLEARFTKSWCRAAAKLGLLAEQDGSFSTPADSRDWLHDSRGFTTSHVHLASRINETMEAVFHGRALPEPPIALRLVLQQSLQRNYQWLYQEVTQEVPEFGAHLQSSTKVLEVGCGLGLGLMELRSQYPSLELYGLEADYECAREAERSTRAIIHIGEQPRFETTFDVVVSFRSLALFSEPSTILKDCFDKLNPGGWLVVGSEMESKDDKRKSAARSSSEKFAYELLAGDSKLKFLDRLELRKILDEVGFLIAAEIDGPDWGTPLFLCTKPT